MGFYGYLAFLYKKDKIDKNKIPPNVPPIPPGITPRKKLSQAKLAELINDRIAAYIRAYARGMERFRPEIPKSDTISIPPDVGQLLEPYVSPRGLLYGKIDEEQPFLAVKKAHRLMRYMNKTDAEQTKAVESALEVLRSGSGTNLFLPEYPVETEDVKTVLKVWRKKFGDKND